MAIRTYKLEIRNESENNSDKVDFGPRKVGDIGRDILIVKKALGSIVPYESLIDENDRSSDLDSTDGWFDCIEGTKLSQIEAATFDENMRTHLTKFQLDNQFYILFYLFTKFSVNQTFEELNKVKERSFASELRDFRAGSQDENSFAIGLTAFGQIPRLPAEGAHRVDEYLNSEYISTQINLIVRMFDLEFGTLGEATLAVLHGWRPRTRVGNRAYHHDPRVFSDQEGAYDIVLWGLWDSFMRGLLAQKVDPHTPDLLEPRIYIHRERPDYRGDSFKGSQFLERYKEQVSSREEVNFSETEANEEYVIRSSYFGALKYRIIPEDTQSPLYDAFVEVSRVDPRPQESTLMTDSDYTDALHRAFEPDPLIDPDPFEVDLRRIGYFYKTNYTLQELPPVLGADPTEEELENYTSIVSELEDLALTQVLQFYNKPDVWILNPESANFSQIYGPNTFPEPPNHDGSYGPQTHFALTTDTKIQDENLSVNLFLRAQNYKIIEREEFGPPLIKFVEFRTPSLRPGDFYRAKFIINRQKLDLITTGTFVPTNEATAELLSEAETSNNLNEQDSSLRDSINSKISCEGEQLSKEQQERRYQEYRALAARRKREIARSIRESVIEEYNNKNKLERTTVDLGVFGNAEINFGGDGSYASTTQAINTLTELMDSGQDGVFARNEIAGVSNPKLSDLSELKITWDDLTSDIEQAAEKLQKAFKNAQDDGVSITPINFNGNTEASRLRAIIPELRSFITKQTNTGAASSSFDFGSDTSGNMSMSGFLGTTSSIHFRFGTSKDNKGLKIISASFGGKKVSTKKLVQSVPSLKNSRTVGYLAQVDSMAAGNIFSNLPACEDIGFGKPGLAYIVKHTVGVSGTSDGEFNPINRWVTNNIENPIERWKEFKKLNNLDSQLDVKFGVDEYLAVYGKQCITIKQFFETFGNRINPFNLLCDLVKCLKLPNFNFTIPDLNFDIPIDIRIFGWWMDMIENLKEIFMKILTQFLCAFAKALIDILNFPFCEEQLRDQLYGSASEATGDIKKALVEGMMDLSLSSDNVEKSKQLIDEMGLFLTGEEFCRILQGGPIDAPTMNMILSLAARLGIQEVDTEDALRQFFQTISLFLPEEFCENLNRSTTTIRSSSCEETSDLLSQIRRQMLANEASDEEIERAVDLANKNLIDHAKALEVLGREGLNGVLPKILDFGNPDALMNNLPPALSSQVVETAKSIFTPAHVSYVSSLMNFGPSLYIQDTRMPVPGDPEYDERSVIEAQTILQNLKIYAMIGEFADGTVLEKLTAQLNALYQVYEVRKIQGATYPAYYVPPFFGSVTKPPGSGIASNFVAIENSRQLSSIDPSMIFLKPVGFSENLFYYESEDSGVENFPEDLRETGVISLNTMKRSLGSENSHLKDFSFVPAYKLSEYSEGNGIDAAGARLAFINDRIQSRIAFLQASLQSKVESISRPISGRTYLKQIKDVLNASFENQRERSTANSPSSLGQEVVTVNRVSNNADTSREVLTLRMPQRGISTSVSLNEFKSTSATNKFDPYTIVITPGGLFEREQTFEYCDKIPGPGLDVETLTEEQRQNQEIYESGLSDIPPGIYTRKELYARTLWKNVKRKVEKIYGPYQGVNRGEQRHLEKREILNGYLDNFLSNHVYETESKRFSEGIFEQIFFSLSNSRLFDEEGYYPGLNARVSGDAHVDILADGSQCYRNRYNISQFGILAFEKIVTDELDNQINRELAKPENDPYNIDFDDIGPIQKAVQNVCLIGFIRICIVELVLKGAVAYSVWDMESIADEPFTKDFFFRFVEKEINRHPSLSKDWKSTASRITGINQPLFALKDIVQKQMLKVQGISKKIYQNETRADYYNWFIKYFIPQVEVSRFIASVAGDSNPYNIRTVGTRVILDPDGTTRIEEANVAEDARIATDKIYWRHPLLETSQIITEEDDYSTVRDPATYAQNLLNGNHPFFHIEHCIEAEGPLARIENLILPGGALVSGIVNASADLAINRSVLARTANNSTRFEDLLNIGDAFNRTNLDPVNPLDYTFTVRPEIPPRDEDNPFALGASAESSSDLNTEHEIYHIDDFIDGLNGSLNSDDLKKIALHYRGLMHYDEDPDAPGGELKNTQLEEAEGFPETIRRTPTRFITKKRRIIKFTQDIVSHNNSTLLNGKVYADSVINFQDFANDLGYADEFFEPNGSLVNSYYNNFTNYIAKTREDENKYYVLPSNGEDFLWLESQGYNVYQAPNDGRFMDKVLDFSRIGVSSTSGEQPNFSLPTTTTYLDDDPQEKPLQPRAIAATNMQSRYDYGRGMSIEDIEETPERQSNDILTHKYRSDSVPTVIFENPIGIVENETEFERIKDRFENGQEETWVETVFEFSDSASIIAGLHGSFTIGETFDPAVLNFDPNLSPRLKNSFDNLETVIDSLYQPGAFRNAFLDQNKGTADPKLTQYGRVFYLRESDQEGPADVYLARPMGIDPHTNREMTKFWLIDEKQSSLNASFLNLDRLDGEEIEEARQQSKRLVINHSVSDIESGIPPSGEDLLPPNMYKIPIRVLITKIFTGDNLPERVYCKVVPPEYIRNINKLPGDGFTENMEKLHEALREIVNEYVYFIQRARSRRLVVGETENMERLKELYGDVPEFSTDFTRSHGSGVRNESNYELGGSSYYSSIERIYSRVFENETKKASYNSVQELDDLFLDRGQLLTREADFQLGPVFTPQSSFSSKEKYFEDTRRDYRHHMQSVNLFYATREEGIFRGQSRSKVGTLRVIHNLSNIFNWYLKGRQRNTLWGHLSRTSPRPMAGGSTQKYPLSTSYYFHENVHRIGGSANRNDPTYDTVATRYGYAFTRWASATLPRKNRGSYDSGTQGVDGFKSGNNFDEIHRQPGFVTLRPGVENDISSIATEGNPYLSNGAETYQPLQVTDLRNWNYFGTDHFTPSQQEGLISDGLGESLVNYNTLETFNFKNAGASLFYADNTFSLVDLSNFIKSCVQRVLIDSHFPDGEPLGITNRGGPLIQGAPDILFDMDGFYNTQNTNTILSILKKDPENNALFYENINPDTYENENYWPSFNFEGVQVFKNNYQGLNINVELLLEAIDFVDHFVTRLCDLAIYQSSFTLKSEATRDNSHRIEAPYRLSVVKRFIRYLKEYAGPADPYSPQQLLGLLWMVSSYNFSSQVAGFSGGSFNRRITADEPYREGGTLFIPNRDRSFTRNDYNRSGDSYQADWAAACLWFIAALVCRKPEISFARAVQEFPSTDFLFRYNNSGGRPAKWVAPSGGYFSRRHGVRAASNLDSIVTLGENRRNMVTGVREDGRSPLEYWNRLKSEYLNNENLLDRNTLDRVPTSLDFIIEQANEFYHEFYDPNYELGNANAPRQGQYNNLILDKLLNPDFWGREDIPEIYSALFRDALSSYHIEGLMIDSRRELEESDLGIGPLGNSTTISKIAKSTGPFSFVSPRNYRIWNGKVEDYLIFFDERMFENIFNVGINDAAKLKFLNDRIRRNETLRVRSFETIKDYYNYLMPRIYCNDISNLVRTKDNVLRNHAATVRKLKEDWTTAFEGYTGINNRLFGDNFVSIGIINSQVVKDIMGSSKLTQIARLVSNSVLHLSADDDSEEGRYNRFLLDKESPIQEVSEEYRSFLMEGEQNKYFSVPIAEYKKVISDFGEGVNDCIDLNAFRESYKRLQPWMTEQLIESPEAKQLFQYIYPVKRYQAVSTAFITSAFSSYGDLSNFIDTPKASLAALLSIAGINQKQGIEAVNNLSKAEFLKQIMNSNSSDLNAIDCFDFPFPADFTKQFKELLKQLFLQFPSLFFRGIANVVDPAYKEMKGHYNNCDINKLTMEGLQYGPTVRRRNMTAGLHGTAPRSGTKDGKYSSILVGPIVDVPYGVAKLFSSFDYKPLGRAIERLTGYIIKGPVSIVDGNFSLSIPCRDVEESWPSENSPWNLQRYGHSLTPFTVLALSTPELAGDKRFRSCTLDEQQDAPSNANISNCDDENSASPFGTFPDPGEQDD